MRKILFYGDSNTYGYDPADWVFGRYPKEIRWTEIVQRECFKEWRVIEEGLNGRKIPEIAYNRERLQTLLRVVDDSGVFGVMLGTNDILCSDHPDADFAVGKMECFLTFLTDQKPASEILLLAPPYLASESVQDALFLRYHEESKKMNRGFQLLAERFGVRFADTASWNVELCFDQVHFSENGHRIFAEKIIQLLKNQMIR